MATVKLTELMKERQLLSFELFPPKTDKGMENLPGTIEHLCEFKPEYISKMDFYLEALDRQKKKENENPSVGMILCASKDDEVVEYAVSRTLSPMMVAEYKLQLPDKAVLQKKLQELVNMPLIEE